MSLPSKIQDGEGSKRKAGVQNTQFGNGLKTYSYDPLIKNSEARFYTNPDFGFNMNQAVTFSGTPEEVFDGEDTVLWTPSTVSGNAADFDYNAVPPTPSPAGGNALSGVNSENNDIFQAAKGSDLTITDYVALTGYIYLTGWSTNGTKGVNIYLHDVGVGTVSDEINIGDYINTGLLNTWQTFVIPLDDMNITSATIDAVRIRTVDIGGGPLPNYYIDQIQFEELGDPLQFEVGPGQGERWSIQGVGWVFVDEFDSTLADATMPNIPYDGLLNVPTLTNGLVLQRLINNEVQSTNVVRDFIDIVGAPAVETTMLSGSDGTATWVKVMNFFTGEVILNGDLEDKFRITLQDDLSGLIRMRVFIRFANLSVEPEVT